MAPTGESQKLTADSWSNTDYFRSMLCEARNIIADRNNQIFEFAILASDLLEALESVESRGLVCDNGVWFAACPCCRNKSDDGHKSDCKLNIAIKKAKHLK